MKTGRLLILGVTLTFSLAATALPDQESSEDTSEEKVQSVSTSSLHQERPDYHQSDHVVEIQREISSEDVRHFRDRHPPKRRR